MKTHTLIILLTTVLLTLTVQTATLRAAEPVTLADFTTMTDLGAWQTSNINNPRVENGVLRGIAKNHDPILLLESVPEAVDCADYQRLVVVLRKTKQHGEAMRIFWETDLNNTLSDNTLTVDTSQFSGRSEVVVDLGKHKSWDGRLTKLRIDPPAGRGQPIQIESIRLEP